MKTPSLLGLSSTIFLLLLSGCKSSSLLDLGGSIKSVSGEVALRTSNGNQVNLDASSTGRGVKASFYDFDGQARLSIRFANEVDPMILQFAQKSTELAPAVQALDAHAVATNQPVAVDLTRGETVPVHDEWDGSDSCIFWQGYVNVCDRKDPNGASVCHQEHRTIYGTAEFHYVKSGNIYYSDLKLTKDSGIAILELADDQTSTSKTQISGCFSNERPPRFNEF